MTTVTFLFTDIEGSTRLWEQHPQAMAAALAKHDALLRQAVEAHGGVVVKTTGDGLHAAFPAALGGVAAVLDAQARLQSPLAGVPLRVRMALHTGEADARGGDYFGPALNRAARLLGLANGGQNLLSAPTADLVRDQLPPGAALRDLGEHRLKDLIRPERVYQLDGPGLRDDFPPPRSLDALPHNLPVQLTSFIGRENEIAEVQQLLQTAHLLTLTGPGGTGKTRLSLQVAADVLEEYPAGAWLVELAPLSDPALVTTAVAGVLGVHEQPGRALLDSLLDYLRAKTLLLVLDNCEHLVDACAQLATTLLRACPNLKLLASSREVLGVAGETAYRVPSLSCPAPRQAAPEAVAASEAARLFVERARSAQPRFALSDHNLGAVAQICHRLDGIPLAIELAAARVKVFSAEQIAARLDDRFRLLTGGSRTALPRQQTLRALIDWSYDLLSEPERAALRALSVFAGGWTFEAAEALLGPDALELLAHFVDKSLVAVDEQDGGQRYRLLETVRQYAREKLFEAREAEQVRNQHLAYYLAWVEASEPQLYGPDMIACLDQQEAEQDNLRAAMEWALESDPHAALRLAAILHVLWGRRGALTEGLNWVRTALARAALVPPEAGAAQPSLLARAKALLGEAGLLLSLGDNLAARAEIEAGIAQARAIGATRVLAGSLGLGAIICGFLGDLEGMRAWGAECLALCRQHGYVYELGMYSGAQLFSAVIAGEPVPPQLVEEYLGAARASGSPMALALATQNAARVSARAGQWDQAQARYAEAAALFQRMRYPGFYNTSESEIGHMLRRQGRYQEAAAVYRRTIRAFQDYGQRAAVAHELESFAFIAGAQGQPERAARLLGAAEALRESMGSTMTLIERREYDATVARLRASADPAAWALAWAAGRALTMEQAIDYALEPV